MYDPLTKRVYASRDVVFDEGPVGTKGPLVIQHELPPAIGGRVVPAATNDVSKPQEDNGASSATSPGTLTSTPTVEPPATPLAGAPTSSLEASIRGMPPSEALGKWSSSCRR